VGINWTGNTKNVKSKIVHMRDERCTGRSGSRVCDRASVEDYPWYVRTVEKATCKQCKRIAGGKFFFNN